MNTKCCHSQNESLAPSLIASLGASIGASVRCLVIFTLALSPCSSFADESFGLFLNVLQPKEYVSASGEFRLLVNPSHLNGAYAGDYQLTSNGMILWSKQLPFTLWDAKVSDEGTVIGYAYTQGVDGIFDRRGDPRPGHTVVAVLDMDGSLRLHERRKREDSRFFHTPPTQLVEGFEISGTGNSFLIRIQDADVNVAAETWAFYDISQGKKTREFRTPIGRREGLSVQSPIHVKPVRGTPLWLVQLWTYSGRPNATGKSGSVFLVVDSHGSTIWKHELLDDYTVGDEETEDTLRERIREGGAILNTDNWHSFEIQLVKEKQAVEFTVNKNAEGKYEVKESRRTQRDYLKHESEGGEQNVSISPKNLPQLPFLGQLALEINRQQRTHPVRSIECGFDFDSEGNFCFVRQEEQKREMVSVDVKGNLLKEFPLKLEVPNEYELDGMVHIGRNEFVLSASTHKPGRNSLAWKIDLDNQDVESFTDFPGHHVKEIVSSQNGKFAVLSTERSKYTMTDSVLVFDAEGQQLASIQQNSSDYPQTLFSPAAIATNSLGEVCVLDVIKQEVAIYGEDGKYRRTMDLEKLWGYRPNYPSGLFATLDGGIVINDFDGRFPLVQMSFGGKVLASLDPREALGRETMYVSSESTRVRTDGRIWIETGEEFVRLADSGLVDVRVGTAADIRKLGDVSEVHVDRDGKCYLLDQRAGAVHVFTSEGSLERVLHHERLQEAGYSKAPIQIAKDGSAFVHSGGIDNESLVEFSNDGTYVKEHYLAYDPAYVLPISKSLLCDDMTQALVTDLSGKQVLGRIRRHTDSSWLAKIESIAVARNDSFAIATGNENLKVTVFDSKSRPQNTWDLMGYAHLDYDGNLLVTVSDRVRVWTSEGAFLGSFALPELKHPTSCRPYLTDKGRRLVIVDWDYKSEPRFLRYDLTSLQKESNQDN